VFLWPHLAMLSLPSTQVFAPGSESHVALAMRLDQRLEAEATAVVEREMGRRGRRTSAAEARLLKLVNRLTKAAEAAASEYFKAVFSR